MECLVIGRVACGQVAHASDMGGRRCWFCACFVGSRLALTLTLIFKVDKLLWHKLTNPEEGDESLEAIAMFVASQKPCSHTRGYGRVVGYSWHA